MRAYLSIALILALPLAGTAAEPGGEDARKLLDTLTEEEKAGQVEVLKITDRKIRSQQHYNTAKRLYEDRVYEEARKEAELAVQYDPSNAEAKKLLRLAESVLAVRRSRIKTMTQHLELRERIKRQEQLMKLQNHVDRAKVLIGRATEGRALVDDSEQLTAEQKLLEEADEELVRAREIAKWMPAYVPVKEFEEAIDQMLDRVFKERKAREDRLMALGKERAHAEAVDQRERTAAFQRRRVRILMDKAVMLFEREDYDQAARLARRILDVDPTNAAAVELETSCRVKAIDKRKAHTTDLKREALRDWVELSRRATIHHSRLLVYPDDWDEVSRRESLEEKRLLEPDWKRNLRAALEKEVNLEFTENSLEECINYLRGLTDANIITDNQAFAAGGVDPKTPITLRLSRTKLGLALKWILRMAKLDYALKNGAIFISTPQNLQGELVQKIYDVRDLTFQLQHFPGPELGLQTGGAGGGAVVLAPPPPTQVVEINTIQDMIKRVIRPTSWGQNNTSIVENNGKLIVVHQPEVHSQISQLLNDFRKSQALQVHVEARYLDVKQGFLEEIGVDWGGNPEATWSNLTVPFTANHPSITTNTNFGGLWDSNYGRPNGAPGRITSLLSNWNTYMGTGSSLSTNYTGVGEGLGAMFTYLGNFQAQALLRAVKKENHGTVLFAPRLTMFNNQRAHVFVGRETAYISNWSSSGGVYTPEVSTAVMDGVTLDVRPVVSHDRRYITLELRPSLVRPVGMRRFSINSNVGGDDDDDGDGIQNGADPTPLGPVGGDIDGDGILNQNDNDVDGDGLNNGSTAGSSLEFSLPELEVRSIRTVVTVPDGGNVLLSGLMTEKTSDQRSGIPFLMNLPILGRLFGNDFKDVERRNLLILVTANLILFSEEEAKL